MNKEDLIPLDAVFGGEEFVIHSISLKNDNTYFTIDGEDTPLMEVYHNGYVYINDKQIGKFHMQSNYSWHFKFNDTDEIFTTNQTGVDALLKEERELFVELHKRGMIIIKSSLPDISPPEEEHNPY